nr:endo-1,3(4)-beta-glucanase [Cryptococcus depauperatus CBS 7855]
MASTGTTDVHSGDVFWATAQNTSLVYVNAAGRVILKVDNTTQVPYLEKRYAPKLLSKRQYAIGTVWVMDAVHMPYGCSVWPGFWTQGPNWPAGGEIDISEGINNRQTNMIALHTSPTAGRCTLTASSSMRGQVTFNNCDNTQNSGGGCTVTDPDTKSYGEGFAQNGGGVYVAEWAKDGVRVWFLSRDKVPSSLSVSADSIDTAVLGDPVALYSSDTCEVEKVFGPQTLTIDITLCGDFAGSPALLAQTCPSLVGSATCYSTYVVNDGSTTYANAYYEINYINVYSVQSEGSDTGGKGAVSATTTLTATAGSGTGGGKAGTKSGAHGRVSLGAALAAVWAGVWVAVMALVN